MNWLRRIMRLPPSDIDRLEARADRIIEAVKVVRIVVVPKNPRAHAELNKLEGRRG
jgi:hypothetical protein